MSGVCFLLCGSASCVRRMRRCQHGLLDSRSAFGFIHGNFRQPRLADRADQRERRARFSSLPPLQTIRARRARHRTPQLIADPLSAFLNSFVTIVALDSSHTTSPPWTPLWRTPMLSSNSVMLTGRGTPILLSTTKQSELIQLFANSNATISPVFISTIFLDRALITAGVDGEARYWLASDEYQDSESYDVGTPVYALAVSVSHNLRTGTCSNLQLFSRLENTT